MNGAEYFVQSKAVFHRGDVFDQQIARVFPGDGAAEYFVAAWRRDDFHQAVRFAVGDGTIQVVDAVGVHLVGNFPFLRFRLVDTDTRDFRVGEGAPRHHRIIDLEFLEAAEQRIHRAKPRHVRGGMRELVGAGDIAAGENIGVDGFQILVDFHHALRRDAECLQAVAFEVGHTAHRT